MAEEHVEDFMAQFGRGRRYGDPASTQERLKAERKAGQTAKQRGKKSVAKKQLNIRATDETHALIAKLAAQLDTTATDIIELAVAELAKSKGVE